MHWRKPEQPVRMVGLKSCREFHGEILLWFLIDGISQKSAWTIQITSSIANGVHLGVNIDGPSVIYGTNIFRIISIYYQI